MKDITEKKKIPDKAIDLTGQKFNKLTVVEFAGKDGRKWGDLMWLCECECGNKKIIRGPNVKNGHTKSCGCITLESSINNLPIPKKDKGISGFNRLFGGYKKGAKSRNLKFNLTREEFSGLTKHNCYYCGIEPSQTSFISTKKSRLSAKEWSKYLYNGIDRKDNTKGYDIENCVPCCKVCNKMKSIMVYDDFLNWIEKIYNHRIK